MVNYFFFLDLTVTSDCDFCQSKGLRRYIGQGGTVIRAAITNPAARIYNVCENCWITYPHINPTTYNIN